MASPTRPTADPSPIDDDPAAFLSFLAQRHALVTDPFPSGLQLGGPWPSPMSGTSPFASGADQHFLGDPSPPGPAAPTTRTARNGTTRSAQSAGAAARAGAEEELDLDDESDLSHDDDAEEDPEDDDGASRNPSRPGSGARATVEGDEGTDAKAGDAKKRRGRKPVFSNIEDRKKNHTLKERERRVVVNDLFADMIAELPPVSKPGKKPSKRELLMRTLEYLRSIKAAYATASRDLALARQVTNEWKMRYTALAAERGNTSSGMSPPANTPEGLAVLDAATALGIAEVKDVPEATAMPLVIPGSSIPVPAATVSPVAHPTPVSTPAIPTPRHIGLAASPDDTTPDHDGAAAGTAPEWKSNPRALDRFLGTAHLVSAPNPSAGLADHAHRAALSTSESLPTPVTARFPPTSKSPDTTASSSTPALADPGLSKKRKTTMPVSSTLAFDTAPVTQPPKRRRTESLLLMPSTAKNGAEPVRRGTNGRPRHLSLHALNQKANESAVAAAARRQQDLQAQRSQQVGASQTQPVDSSTVQTGPVASSAPPLPPAVTAFAATTYPRDPSSFAAGHPTASTAPVAGPHSDASARGPFFSATAAVPTIPSSSGYARSSAGAPNPPGSVTWTQLFAAPSAPLMPVQPGVSFSPAPLTPAAPATPVTMPVSTSSSIFGSAEPPGGAGNASTPPFLAGMPLPPPGAPIPLHPSHAGYSEAWNSGGNGGAVGLPLGGNGFSLPPTLVAPSGYMPPQGHHVVYVQQQQQQPQGMPPAAAYSPPQQSFMHGQPSPSGAYGAHQFVYPAAPHPQHPPPQHQHAGLPGPPPPPPHHAMGMPSGMPY
ncbi:hypothetical protein AMAG_16044 [Allomyces macrogynus ATCC 38327]|uniref:BHLH domain-containing protein n=1 Tax=Allomyces macrogynus (strain ATCC 38327) TaxID=578462 RepID=A0A0L0TA93_ALLM3|nr:hypothetical protein, variant [Allomyces macrogynus ATCC 38327]KNE71739.1 hypothetical protein AMAG_16044 [Allomyces macrogynus ATCC 38327]|eukprot:KNE71738.1 hypothetical protein, variant [Allomyces macrogynus ATCC 38327]